MDNPVRELDLAHPVLPGGASFEWARRRLRMSYDPTPNRRGIQAKVSFLDSEGAPHTTAWPMTQRDS